MREKEIIENLQQNIVIPNIVQQRADDALRTIRKENSKVIKLHSHKRKWKTIGVAVAAVVLMLGMTVCAAAYIHWSKGLESEFQMTQEEKQFLQEQRYMTPITEEDETPTGVTAAGVTITPLQMIVDDRFAWLSFKVEGYDLEEGKEPCFDMTSIVINDDPEADISYFSSFYNGIHCNENGIFLYDDGTLAEDAEGNVIEKYMDEDGCMEYIIRIYGSGYEKGLVGSSMKVAFHNLGTVYKAEYFPDLEADWEFSLELKGSEAVRKATLSELLGDSGATVTYAEISPISLYVAYDFPMQEEALEGVNEDGEQITSTTFVEPPRITGVRLKDGTLLTGIVNGGAEGYMGSDREVYTASFALNHVIDTKEVDALLFVKDIPGGEDKLTAENLYIVPIE